MTQLTPFRARRADRLSGGMKQKLALACTLVHEPRDPAARRADDRRRPGVAPRVLEAALRVPLARAHHRDGDAVPRRSGALRAGRAAARGAPAGARRRRSALQAALAGQLLEVIDANAAGRRWSSSRACPASTTCRPSATARTCGSTRRRGAEVTAAIEAALADARVPERERPADCRVARGRLHRSDYRKPPHEMRVLRSPAMAMASARTSAQPAIDAAAATSNDAIAQGLANSQRLAELRGARRSGRLRDRRAPRRATAVAGRCSAVTRAPTTSTSSPFATPIGRPPEVHLPGRARQLPHPARPAVADLHRRADRRARAGGARRARRDRQGPRGRPRRPPPRDHARLLGGGHRAGGRSGARSDRSRPSTAHVGDVQTRLDVGPHAAQRRVVGRGAGGAPARARARGCQPARHRGGRSASVDRQRYRDDRAAVSRSLAGGALPPPPAWRLSRWKSRRVDCRRAQGAPRAPGARSSGPTPRPSAPMPRRAAARPQVAVAGGYDYARPNPRIFPRAADWKTSWDASVNVSWTLWDGGRRDARAGGSARDGVGAEDARRRLRSAGSRFEVRAAHARARLEPPGGRRGRRGDPRRGRSRARRSASATRPASPPAPTSSTRRSRCLQAELDRTRAHRQRPARRSAPGAGHGR